MNNYIVMTVMADATGAMITHDVKAERYDWPAVEGGFISFFDGRSSEPVLVVASGTVLSIQRVA